MKYEVFQTEDNSDDYIVEAIALPGEGEIFTTIFSGPDSRERAEEYAGWKEGQGAESKAA
jgi:hypothetical protein